MNGQRSPRAMTLSYTVALGLLAALTFAHHLVLQTEIESRRASFDSYLSHRTTDAKFDQLESLDSILSGVSLVAILMTAVFVCRPMAHRVQSEIAKLGALNKTLEQQVADRTAEAEERAHGFARTNEILNSEIAERKRTETVLRASEERYRALTQSAIDAIVSADGQGNIVSWNNGARTIFGYSEDEVLGKPLPMLMPDRYKEAHQRGLKRMESTGQSHVIGKVVELHGLRKDGAEFPLELALSSWKAGEQTFYTGIIRDITKRRQAEEAVRVSEERFRLLVANLKDYAIFMLDSEGYVISWNTGAERIRGFRAEEILGQHFSRLYPPEDIEAGKPEMELKVASAEGRFEDEGWRVRKDGSRFWANVVITALRDEAGQLRGFAKVSRDVTERKLREEQLEKANLELKKSHTELKALQWQLIEAEKMETVGRLAAGVAHEVKNPLAIITMGVDCLSGQIDNRNDELAEMVKDMGEAVNRADRVIRGLLDFSAPGELELKVENLNAVVEQALLLIKHEVTRSHINLVQELSEGLPTLWLDRNKVEQVFVNIFMNAVHAMPEGGTLSVKTFRKQLTHVRHRAGNRGAEPMTSSQHVVVAEVEDTGTGIAKEELAKVFDPFFTTKPTGKGTGLGLTVTKKIVEVHGATIDIANREEGGVRVTLTFPA